VNQNSSQQLSVINDTQNDFASGTESGFQKSETIRSSRIENGKFKSVGNCSRKKEMIEQFDKFFLHTRQETHKKRSSRSKKKSLEDMLCATSQSEEK
jgi:hypothetical protein